MVGRILFHYKVLEALSRGGMGIVYRALDLKLGRDRAEEAKSKIETV
jgi:hypothetical protein